MSLAFQMPRVRTFASDELARDLVGRLVRFALVLVGTVIVLAGILIAPLPGPGGLPVIVVGLMIVLRNSFKARRQFVRFHRAHPRMLSPIRRLLTRDPEFLLIFWQQALRVERLILPKRFRILRVRRALRRKRARAAAA